MFQPGLLLKEDETPSGSKLFFASDDQQRCHMSGQVLIDAMFRSDGVPAAKSQKVVPWHTHDFEESYLWPNWKLCPRLKEVWNNSFHTRAYAALKQVLKI